MQMTYTELSIANEKTWPSFEGCQFTINKLLFLSDPQLSRENGLQIRKLKWKNSFNFQFQSNSFFLHYVLKKIAVISHRKKQVFVKQKFPAKNDFQLCTQSIVFKKALGTFANR